MHGTMSLKFKQHVMSISYSCYKHSLQQTSTLYVRLYTCHINTRCAKNNFIIFYCIFSSSCNLTPLLVPWSRKSRAIPLLPPMGCTACTEPQCLYKGALYLFFTLQFQISVNPLNAELNPICYWLA